VLSVPCVTLYPHFLLISLAYMWDNVVFAVVNYPFSNSTRSHSAGKSLNISMLRSLFRVGLAGCPTVTGTCARPMVSHPECNPLKLLDWDKSHSEIPPTVGLCTPTYIRGVQSQCEIQCGEKSKNRRIAHRVSLPYSSDSRCIITVLPRKHIVVSCMCCTCSMLPSVIKTATYGCSKKNDLLLAKKKLISPRERGER
jgi:hypothetical protein